MLKGKYVFIESREVKSKDDSNSFTIARFGDNQTFTKFDVFVPSDVEVNGLQKGSLVDIEIDLEQRGYKLSATLRAVQ